MRGDLVFFFFSSGRLSRNPPALDALTGGLFVVS